jgi:hypothetical protein
MWVPAGGSVSASTSELGKDVSLSCSDGTALQLTLDTPALTALTDAVTSISLYPAGDPALTCSLSQSTSLTSFTSFRTLSSTSSTQTMSAGGNPQYDYAVGGGQATVLECGQSQDFVENFALSAHVATSGNPTDAYGTFNLTVSAKPDNVATCVAEDYPAQLRSKIECLTVSGNIARFRARVTKATGLYTNPFATTLVIYGAVLDNGTPTPPVLTDMIGYRGRTQSADPCGDVVPNRPITHGNISVHDG